MAAPNQPQQLKPHRRSLVRIVLIIIAVLIVVIVGASYWFALLIHSSISSSHSVTIGKSSLNAELAQQQLLSYANATTLVPYALVNYNDRNVTSMIVKVVIYTRPPARSIYIVNWSNECAGCSNMDEFMSALNSDLDNYSVLNATSSVQIVQPSALTSIKPDSVLIVPNGYLPDSLLGSYNGSTVIQNLLNSGTTIIYIGRNFSRLITSQSVLVPDTNPPAFLSYTPTSAYTGPSAYFFNQTTFYILGGEELGPISYLNVTDGHIISFSNFIDSWKSPQDAAADISLTIFQKFWLTQYASGTVSFSVPNETKYSGTVGVPLNNTMLLFSPQLPSELSKSYGAIVIEGSNNNFVNSTGTIYRTVYFTPQYTLSGSIGMPGTVFPGIPVTAFMSIYVNSTQQLEPNIDIYTTNLSFVASEPPIFSKEVVSNYSFISTFMPSLKPGSYIAELNGFEGQHYASSLFTVPGINFNLLNINFSLGTYTFQATAGGVPVNNETANIMVNGEYETSVPIQGGSFVYRLPIGTSPPSGNLTFNINASGQAYQYATYYAPPSVAINKQYIEFIIAIIIVILEITLVKAPTRDDFYIDVPTMPEPAKAEVKLKPDELIGVFDKLNLYYHWRYMPLTNTEFRFAISNNIRVASMPVTLTYNNIDVILDSLAAKGLLVSMDGLYAPKAWIEQSKHDIEYLSVFKKMRVYLVSSAHILTDLDKSDIADIVTTFHNEKAYIVIYSSTSRFMKNIPVQPPIKTYIAFLNSDRLEEFKQGLYMSVSRESEELKMYIATGSVVLLDSDNPGALLT